jgi:hypothetical protein
MLGVLHITCRAATTAYCHSSRAQHCPGRCPAGCLAKEITQGCSGQEKSIASDSIDKYTYMGLKAGWHVVAHIMKCVEYSSFKPVWQPGQTLQQAPRACCTQERQPVLSDMHGSVAQCWSCMCNCGVMCCLSPCRCVTQDPVEAAPRRASGTVPVARPCTPTSSVMRRPPCVGAPVASCWTVACTPARKGATTALAAR